MRFKKITALLLAAALTITGIYIPADTQKVYATEVELTDSTEAAEVQESAIEGEAIAYVRSAKEMISALNGQSISGPSIKISLESKFEEVNDDTYEIAKEDVNLDTGIVLPENTQVTLAMNSQTLSLSGNLVQSSNRYLKMVVPKTSTLTITGNNYGIIPFEIENKGVLKIIGSFNIKPEYGNGILNTGEADIEEDVTINYDNIKEDNKERAPINNQGGTFVINTNGKIDTNDDDVTNSSSILNVDGHITIEKAHVGTLSASGNTVCNKGNKAVLEVRGGAGYYSAVIESKTNCAVLNNQGSVLLQQGTSKTGSSFLTNYVINGKIGIMNYNGGSLTMYDGMVTGHGSNDGAAIATTPFFCSENLGSVSDGSVNILGGNVGEEDTNYIGIAYAGDNVPSIKGGDVYGTEGAVVKISSEGSPSAVTGYQFKNKDNKLTDAFTPANGSNPAKALTHIENGLNPYGSQSVSFNGVTVNTFAELKTAVAKGGNIKLGSSIEVTEDLNFQKDATLNFGNAKTLIISDANVQITIDPSVNVSFEGIYFQVNAILFKALSATEPGLINRGTLTLKQMNISSDEETTLPGTLVQNAGTIRMTDSHFWGYLKGKSAAEPAVVFRNTESGNAVLDGYSSVIDERMNEGYTIAVQNQGSLSLNMVGYSPVVPEIKTVDIGGIALDNKGTVVANGSVNIISYAKNAIAVKNQGSFIMENGAVQALQKVAEDNHAYGILYDGDHIPQLIGGLVTGGYMNQVFTVTDRSQGAAVSKVTDWDLLKTETGFYKDAAGTVKSGQDAVMIMDGIIRTDATLNEVQDGYLLMEKGEIITDCFQKLFEAEYVSAPQGNAVYEITTTSANVVSVSQNGDGTWNAKAEGTGSAVLRAKLQDSGITESIRIDVVEKRSSLTADSYQGSILEKDVVYNAYQSSLNIPLEWHLKDDYDVTAGDTELSLSEDQVKPTEIILESQDPDFSKYFYYKTTIRYNRENKGYYFVLQANANSSKEYNYLVNNEVKEFKDIAAKLKVYLNGKTEVVDIGKFNIVVDQTKPEFKYNQITLNSAFNSEASYFGTRGTVYPNKALIDNYAQVRDRYYITGISCPNGFSPLKMAGDIGNTYYNVLKYTGTPKSGNYSIPVTVTSKQYNGYFESVIPVKVVNEKPKTEIASKKLFVTKQTAEASDIPLLICGKTEASVAAVSKVEIVEKDSSFTVENSVLGKATPIIYNNNRYEQLLPGNSSFYLQPRKEITKAEKVTLKFTYKGVRGSLKSAKSAGVIEEPCDYTTTTTITVVPQELSSASMKQTNKPVVMAEPKYTSDKNIKYDYDVLNFTTTPSNYNGGYFVVTGLNGKAIQGLDVGKVEKQQEEQDGLYVVHVYANSATKPGKVQFGICWYDKNGKQIGKTLKASVTVLKKSQLEIKNKNVTVDIGKELTLDKNGRNITFTTMGADVKYTATSDWYSPTALDDNFNVTGTKKGAFTIAPVVSKVQRGAIVPGKTYAVNVRFGNNYGDSKIETIQVKVADLGQIKAKVADATLYKNAPYERTFLTIDTTKPAYGLYVTKVEITDAGTPFETKAIAMVGTIAMNQGIPYGQQALWSVTLKNNKYNKKLIGKNQVNLKITYQNGSTTTTKMNVYVK